MPGSDRPVIIDATPIIALSIVGQLELLRQLFEHVLLPEAVRGEVLAGGSHRPGAAQLREAFWMHTVSLADPRRADLLSDLDRGEAEVITLALEREAGLVILDERLARAHAKRLELPVTGTLGILLRGKEAGHLPRIRPLVERIVAGGIRLGTPLVDQVLRLAGEAV